MSSTHSSAAALPNYAASEPRPLRQEFLYYAAGSVVEQVSGQAWEDFTRQWIFEPLGMKATLFDDAQMLKQPDHAVSYFEKRDTPLLRPIPFTKKSVYSVGAIPSSRISTSFRTGSLPK